MFSLASGLDCGRLVSESCLIQLGEHTGKCMQLNVKSCIFFPLLFRKYFITSIKLKNIQNQLKCI